MKEDITCIVKIKTEAFKRGDSYFYGKSIRVIKRLTTFDLLSEESGMIGIQEALENILNINETLKNGYYELVVCHKSFDIESGYLDDWNFKLIPYIEDCIYEKIQFLS